RRGRARRAPPPRKRWRSPSRRRHGWRPGGTELRGRFSWTLPRTHFTGAASPYGSESAWRVFAICVLFPPRLAQIPLLGRTAPADEAVGALKNPAVVGQGTPKNDHRKELRDEKSQATRFRHGALPHGVDRQPRRCRPVLPAAVPDGLPAVPADLQQEPL